MGNEEFQHQEYIDNAKKAINFFLACHQWSGLKRSEVESWIANFPNTQLEKYYVYRLIHQLLYYSEKDMQQLLKIGIFDDVLCKELLLSKQIPSGFKLTQQELQFELRIMIEKTLFVPLLDIEKPFESGNQISRMLTQKLGISTTQVTFSSQINPNESSYKHLIIVDDCIGSGDQCRKFWKSTIISNGELLSNWCVEHNIKAHYVVLVGYEENIANLAIDIPDLNINCVELLQVEHKVFSENSIYWNNKEEARKAKQFFMDITSDIGIPLLGYNDMDFAVIMHLNIPDWSLPVFWKRISDWDILMERKNSNG